MPAKKTAAAPKTAKKAKEESAATSKFAEFLKAKKVDPRRILIASHKLESFVREDRQIRLAKRQGKGKEESADKKEVRKPRSGRPVTERAMTAALTGGSLSGPTKTRILRAVNHILEQKKQDKVDLKALF